MKMSNNKYIEKEITETHEIQDYIESIEGQARELVLTSKGEIVGAVLTKEQYDWFLDQIDETQDISSIASRTDDLDDSIGLDDFKKELKDE